MKNVVFIVTDSLRKDSLGVYNSSTDFTENIDNLAEEATVFGDAVSTSPWTLPSHASFFTGMYPWEHGATQRNLKLEVDRKTLAEKFSEEGYDTYCFSINGFLQPHSGLLKGFEDWKSFNLTDRLSALSSFKLIIESWLAEESGFIKRNITRIGDYLFHYSNLEMKETEKILDHSREAVSNSESFFLFMNLMDAHEPYYPPEEYRKKHEASAPSEICQNPADHYSGRKEADFEKIVKLYDASVDYMDDQLGKFFRFLKEEGEWEDTLVVLISDHGQMLGDEGHYGHQFSVHEKLVSVPMIVKGSGEENIGGR